MDDYDTERRMEVLRKRLHKAVKTDGVVTYKELSEAVGQNGTYVQQFVTKKTPKRLHGDQEKTIVAMLDAREAGTAPARSPAKVSADVTSRLLQLVGEAILKPADLQAQIVDFIEGRLEDYSVGVPGNRDKARKVADPDAPPPAMDKTHR